MLIAQSKGRAHLCNSEGNVKYYCIALYSMAVHRQYKMHYTA